MDDVCVKGMFTLFTYEEFHPNHKNYDLRRRSVKFAVRLLEKEWEEYACQFYLTILGAYKESNMTLQVFHPL